MISSDEVDAVRHATDFVSVVAETVVLRQRSSGDFWGCCPFHHEKSPSFHVDTSKGLWYCFGCGTGGDVFDYISKRENLEFPDAVRYLAERAGIELHEEGAQSHGPKRNRLIECMEETARFYHTQLMRVRAPGNDEARSYLSKRGFGSKVAKDWKLGYAPGRGALVAHLRRAGFSGQEMVAANVALAYNGKLRDRFYERVMFPVADERGHVVALGGRTITGADAKYINTSETPIFHKGKQLFAFHRAKESIVAKGEVMVVEGYADAISLHEAGFTNVVAALGTALTPDHIKLLSRLKPKRIVMMLDGDAPGQAAAEKVVRYIDRTDAAIVCVVLPDGADPDEFVRAHGAAALEALVADAQPLMDFVFSKRLAQANLDTPGGRMGALEGFAEVLAPLKGSPLLEGYGRRVADALGIEIGEVLRRVKESPDDGGRTAATAAPAPEDGPWESPWEGYDDMGAWEPAPEEAPMAAAPAAGDLGFLGPDERAQYKHERELVCLMASHPGVWGSVADRIGKIRWVDGVHGTIAQALLACSAGTTPAQAVVKAQEAAPAAKAILAAGEIDSRPEADLSRAARFLLDNIELFSVRRRLRSIRAELGGALDEERSRQLLQEVVDLQAQESALQSRLMAS